MNALTILKELTLIVLLMSLHAAHMVSAVAYAIAVRLALPICVGWLVLPTGVPSIFTLLTLAWVGPVGLAFWLMHIWDYDDDDDDTNDDTNDDDDDDDDDYLRQWCDQQ